MVARDYSKPLNQTSSSGSLVLGTWYKASRTPPESGIMTVTTAASFGDLRHLLPGNYKRLIAAWLEEDCPGFDYGGFVVGESPGEAKLLGKSKV